MINIIEIAFFVISGLLLRCFHFDSGKLADGLNITAVYVALPALILLKVPFLEFSFDTFMIAMFAWLMVIFSVAIILLASYEFSWSRPITGALLMVVPLGNTGFMGVPMIKAFFGDSGLPHLIIYDQLGTLLILVSYGSFIAARFGEGAHLLEVRSLLKKIFLFPPMVAFIIALMLRGFNFPGWFSLLLKGGAVSLTPLVMTAIGLQLKVRLRKHIFGPFALGMSVKLLVAPVTVYLICRLFRLEGMAFDVTVLEAGMPPMITAGAMAVAAKMDADLAVAMSGLGILLAFISLPVLFFVLL